MPRYGAILLSLLVPIAGAACSSGEDRLSEEEFLKQANAICAEGNAELDELTDELIAGGEEPSAEEIEDFIATGVANVRGQVDEIEELSPPEDLEADIDALLEAVRADADALEEAGAAAVEEGGNPFADSNEKATGLGLDDCADES